MFDAKVRSIFVLDDKKVVFFRGRKQPNIVGDERRSFQAGAIGM